MTDRERCGFGVGRLLDKALSEILVWLVPTGCAVAVSISLHDDYWPVISNMIVFPSASHKLTATE